MGDGFYGSHDEIALGDAAFKQRWKGIHGPNGFLAEDAQFVQPGLMLEYQFIQARPGAPEGFSMGGRGSTRPCSRWAMRSSSVKVVGVPCSP